MIHTLSRFDTMRTKEHQNQRYDDIRLSKKAAIAGDLYRENRSFIARKFQSAFMMGAILYDFLEIKS